MFTSSDIHYNVITHAEAVQGRWDVLILGAGVGGCTAAYSLAAKGQKVLLIEKGKASFQNPSETGVETETEDPVERVNHGRWPEKLTIVVDGKSADIWPSLDCGVGCSSLLYSAALSRLEPIDFLPQQIADGRTISWPFSYREIEPYYEQAEQLYSVRGTLNPLSKQSPWPLGDPLPVNELDSYFLKTFHEAGLNPFRRHFGVKYVTDCTGCAGRLCAKNCNQSAVQSRIMSILDRGFISILEDTEAFSYENRVMKTGSESNCR